MKKVYAALQVAEWIYVLVQVKMPLWKNGQMGQYAKQHEGGHQLQMSPQ